MTDGNGSAGRLPSELAWLERSREEIAKRWLIEVIEGSPLAELERLPVGWAASELPGLISGLLRTAGEGETPLRLSPEELGKVARLAELRSDGVSGAQLARELAKLQVAILAALRRERPHIDSELLGTAAERLAALFGEVTGAGLAPLLEQAGAGRDPATGLDRPERMRQRILQLVAEQKRYGHPFAMVVLDVEEPAGQGAGRLDRNGAFAVVAAALRESIRLADEAYRLEEDELLVLAPNQTAADATRMAERLSAFLSRLAANGLRIDISGGVVACPEHGDDPERLLRAADTAMWRARATGQQVTIGALQDR